MIKAKDIMIEDFTCLSPDDSVFDAAKFFSGSKLSGAPVVKDGKLIGIITHTDIVRFLDVRIGSIPKFRLPGLSYTLLTILRILRGSQRLREEIENIKNVKVRNLMSTDIITVSSSTNFLKLARIMDENVIHILPVVRKKRPIGIITGNDMMKALVKPQTKVSRAGRIKKRLKRRKSS